ncbi:MAG TPA: phosphotransferase [Steroidobacteraceae bacterium]|nr:phosphotransferase [Steroidobacteraceae bacterium]
MLNATLQQAVAAAASVADPHELHLVQCSSTGATGAIIFHAWVRGDSQPRVVVKTPRDTRLQHALQREWDAVTALRVDPRLAALIPAALATFDCDGAKYYAYAGVPGRTMYSRFRNRILASRDSMLERFAVQALDVSLRVHATHTREATSHEVARDLLMDLAWLEGAIPEFPQSVAECGRAFAHRLADARHHLPRGRVHGDFSPYNVLTTGMRVGVEVRLIDWEHTEAERPQHLDVFRFVSACVLLGLRGQARHQAFGQMPARAAGLVSALLRPWLHQMTAGGAATWLEPEMLEALWWHYWTHAARREQERRARPDDYRDATYLPGLVALSQRIAPPVRSRSSAFAC